MSHKILAAVLSFGAVVFYASTAFAWTPPSGSAPSNNVTAPLNVGAIAQSRQGGLLLNTGGATNGLLVQLGRVGIDNVSPAYTLDVSGTTNASQYCIAGANCISAWPTGAASQWTTSGSSIYYNSGNVGIGTASPGYKLDVSGTVQAAAFVYSSDARLKENIQPLSDALNRVLQLQGVSFDWKADGRNDLGLIAQNVQKVFPEAVSTNTQTGFLSVEYGNLIAPVIEAVKTLAGHDASQDAAVAALQTKVAAQEAEIAQLKAAVEALKK